MRRSQPHLVTLATEAYDPRIHSREALASPISKTGRLRFRPCSSSRWLRDMVKYYCGPLAGKMIRMNNLWLEENHVLFRRKGMMNPTYALLSGNSGWRNWFCCWWSEERGRGREQCLWSTGQVSACLILQLGVIRGSRRDGGRLVYEKSGNGHVLSS